MDVGVMEIPIQTTLFNYSEIFLPVQALRDTCMEHVLTIESIFEAANIECETNALSREILFFEERNVDIKHRLSMGIRNMDFRHGYIIDDFR